MTNAAVATTVRQTSWKGRPAWQLANGVIEVAVLEGGGHIAELHFHRGAGPTENVLWEAPWKGIDPDKYQPSDDPHYGGPIVGRFLASYTGHALCLDYFGAPSDEEAARGLTLHGEAGVRTWQVSRTSSGIRGRVNLPYAGLEFERIIGTRPGESVLYIEETVRNQRSQPRTIHWVQHVTLGAPLLAAGESSIAVPAQRAKTWPLGYEGKSLVPDDTEFTWPKLGDLDLSRPFSRTGKGTVAGALLKKDRATAFIAALNWRLGLLFGYVFCRDDFPWVAVWEENRARTDAPWHGSTQARGLEFGTTAMPIGKQAAGAAGPLFGTPTSLSLAAGSSRTVRYLAFVAKVPKSWRAVADVWTEGGNLVVNSEGGETVKVSASGADRIGSEQ